MKPYFKILIVAENAADLKQKSLELAESFGNQTIKCEGPTDRSIKTELVKDAEVEVETKKEVKFNISPASHNVEQMEVQGLSSPYVAEAVELDSSGLPWDARIHVDTKTKKTDGTWINRRKLDDALKASVEAELRKSYPVIKVTDSTKPEQVFSPVATPPVTQAPPPVSGPVAPMPPAPAPVAVKMTIEDAHDIDTFSYNLPSLLVELFNAGKLNTEYVTQLKTWLSVSELVDVIGSREKTEALFNLFVQYKFIKSK